VEAGNYTLNKKVSQSIHRAKRYLSYLAVTGIRRQQSPGTKPAHCGQLRISRRTLDNGHQPGGGSGAPFIPPG